MAKFYSVNKTIGNTTYTAQFNGISAALKAVDSSYIDGTDNTSTRKMAEYLFENVIVEPKTKINDFGADKIGETKTKTISGVEYTAKFNGILEALKAVDGCYVDGTSNTSTEKLSEYLLKEVIVSPENLTIDDFDNMDDFNEVISFAREVMQGGKAMDDFNEVISFAREVMQGNFRDKKDSGTAKKKG